MTISTCRSTVSIRWFSCKQPRSECLFHPLITETPNLDTCYLTLLQFASKFDLLCTGDLNADPNFLKTQWNKLQYFCGSNYLKTCITEVTRLTATSGTTLDQIVINKKLAICNNLFLPLWGGAIITKYLPKYL